MATPKPIKLIFDGVGPLIGLVEMGISAVSELADSGGESKDGRTDYLLDVLRSARGERKRPGEVLREILEDIAETAGLATSRDLAETGEMIEALAGEEDETD